MTALDPVLAEIATAAAAGPGSFEGPIESARQRLAEAISAHPDDEMRALAGEIHAGVARQGSAEVPVRITIPGNGPADLVVVFLHGGGYALGSAELSDDICRRLSVQLNAAVIAVDHRLVPESPFSAVFEDVVTATRWAIASRAEFAAPAAPVVLFGESAGANLAAAASIEIGANLAGQVLVVPAPDLPALREVGSVPGSMLSPDDLDAIARLAFDGDWGLAAAFPASAKAGTRIDRSPPTVVALAGYDPTAPVGRSYAELLAARGVAVELLSFESMFHPFLGFAHLSPGAAEAFSAVCAATLRLVEPAVDDAN